MYSEIDRRTFLTASGTVALLGVATVRSGDTVASTDDLAGVDWTHDSHDAARTAAAPAGVGPAGDVGEGWRYGTGGRPGSPHVYGGRLYTQTDRPEAVVALDPRDGSTVWERTYDDIGFRTHGIVATDGQLVADHGASTGGGSSGGGLLALDAETGESLWQTTLEGDPLPPAVADGRAFTLARTDETPYVHAVGTSDGASVWSERVSGVGEQFRLTVADGTVFALGGNVLRALDAASGAQRWALRPEDVAEGYAFATENPLSAADGRLYVPLFRPGSGIEAPVVAVSTRSGEILSSRTIEGVAPVQTVVADDAVYVVGMEGRNATASAGRVAALSPSLSDVRWEYRNSKVAPFRGPIVVGNQLCLVDVDFAVYALDRSTGDPLWQVSGGFAVDHLAASGGDLFTGNNRRLVALRGDGIGLSAPDTEVVAGLEGRVTVSMTNSLRSGLSSLSLTGSEIDGDDDESGDDGESETDRSAASLGEFESAGVPESLPALGRGSAAVTFRAERGSSGTTGVRIEASGDVEGSDRRATGEDLSSVTVHEPFELDASIAAITDPVLAGEEASFKFEVVGNPIRELGDVGFQLDTDALPGAWPVASATDDEFSAPGQTDLDVYPDMGRWEWSPVDDARPFWGMDPLPADLSQRPGLTLQVPPDVDEGEYSLPVTGYAFAHDPERRWAVEDLTATFRVVQQYAEAEIRGPEEPRTFGEEVPIDLTLTIGDEALDDLSVTLSNLPDSLGLQSHDDDGAEFSTGGDTVTWRWPGRTEAGVTLEPAATFEVAENAEGGSYDIVAAVGGTPTVTEGDVDETAATSVGIQGLEWYVDQKTGLADRLDALSADSFAESPAVESVLEGIVATAEESDDVTNAAAARGIERLIYGEEATERVLVALRRIDADVAYDEGYNFEVSYLTAKAALNTLVYGLLIAAAVELAIARVSPLIGSVLSSIVGQVAKGVKNTLTGMLGEAGKIALAGLVGIFDQTFGNAAKALPGTAAGMVADVTEAVEPVVEETANWLASAVVRRGSHLGRQLERVQADDYAYLADQPGTHRAAKRARFATVGEVTRDAEATTDIIADLTETPGEDIAASIIDLLDSDASGLLGQIVSIVEGIVGLFADLIDAVVDLAFGYPAALGMGISSHYVMEGTYATGLTAITDGTEPDLNARLGSGGTDPLSDRSTGWLGDHAGRFHNGGDLLDG